MSDVVLYYFPIKARGESIKIALQLAHIPYTNRFIQDWKKEKEEGLKNGTLPFGQVPMLHIDGLDIVQSMSILHYISRKYLSKDLDDVTRVHLDMMLEGWNDFRGVAIRGMKTEESMKKFVEGERKTYLTNLENLHIRCGKRFMVSDTPTVADAYAYAIIRMFEDKYEGFIAEFDALKKWKSEFESLEEVKAYNAL